MKILVTGGRGFIGGHLVTELRRGGHNVWSCDLRHDDGPRSLRCDVAEYREMARVFDAGPFDFVYHLAAEFGRWNGEDYYEALWRTNVIGTKNVLRFQEKERFRLVFFSSSEVYGDWSGIMSEDVMERFEVRQLNDYAITKWVGELQLLNSAEVYKSESVRVRLFNVYGAGEPWNRYRSALSRFVHSALACDRIVVHRGHSRSWLYITDAVRTLANIVDHFTPGEVYNIGSEESVSMEELAETVVQVTGCDPKLFEYADEEPRTTHNKRVDCSKARRDLGHAPFVKLRDGVRHTAEWVASQNVVQTFVDSERDGAKLSEEAAGVVNLHLKAPE